jgi:hypothetical protein
MTEGSVGFPRHDADESNSPPLVARVFSLDAGGLVPVAGVDDSTRSPMRPDPVALTEEGASSPVPVVPPSPVDSVGWDEISADRLRESAANQEARGVYSETEVAAPVGMAWYEVVLGVLLGTTGSLGMYEWSQGGLGPFIVVPATVLGLILLAIPRYDIRHLGFGLLVSVPVTALLGLGLWYAAEVF